MNARCMKDVSTRIQMEYLEMPDLKLTLPQARRLFALPLDQCESALESLVAGGFLARTRDGAFMRGGGITHSAA